MNFSQSPIQTFPKYLQFTQYTIQIPSVYVEGGFPGGSVVKESPANAGDEDSILGLGRLAGEGNGNPLQYSCLENPTDEETSRLQFMGVQKSWIRLSN